eukprot:TRINITY_DN1135_c0_g1_i1.p1 TRINITY_DN1135_c0_g1~~TRINITY_DN1135_c0_g1_i1.p1  ORF type:complete len:179 (-),score=34.49 TRINITY_DN1135_c0_g1_i1:216-752(-)
MDVAKLRPTSIACLDVVTEPDGTEKRSAPVALALDMIQDPQNFGAILRSAYFFGIRDVIVCSRDRSPLSAAVSKASAGALEYMSVRECKDLVQFLVRSKHNGWTVVGAARHPSAVNVRDLVLAKPTLVVMGNEGVGLRDSVLKVCDRLVEIATAPGQQDIDSLNVSVATGILLHAFTR